MKPLVAAYTEDGRLISVLAGPKTQLSTGNGMAVDRDGTMYVVVYDSTLSSGPLRLLVFPPQATGDSAPERTALLRGPVLPGHANGLALDGHGNFWVAAIGKLLRYPTSARGSVRPNASIALKLDTPDGDMPANASNVALDAAGNVYCSCTVVYQGNQAIGVSEYTLGSGKATLVRSFYDLSLPEMPPTSIAIDGSGTIYLASSSPHSGIFAYDATTGSGSVHAARRFVSVSTKSVTTIAADASGKVYAGSESRIVIFGPNADGRLRHLPKIVDAAHLEYVNGTYGTLLDAP
jgi:sugar lactone lactonase YvrE